jgi:hypothetical protein
MMNRTATSVASGRSRKGLAMYPSIRSHLMAGGAVASAAILALGLVTAPPDFDGAGTEPRAVQLAAVAVPPAPAGALLKEIIDTQAEVIALFAPLVPGADITNADVTSPTGSVTPLTRASATDLTVNNQEVGTALAVTPDETLASSAILTNLILLPVLLPFVLAFFGTIFVVSMIQNFFYCRENGCASTPLSEPAPVTLAEAGPVEEAQATVIDQSASNGRKQDVGTDRTTPRKERVGTDRASSNKERVDTDRVSSSKERVATDRVSSSKERVGSDRASSSKERVGTDRASSSKDRVGSDRASTSKQTKRADKPAAGRSSDASS